MNNDTHIILDKELRRDIDAIIQRLKNPPASDTGYASISAPAEPRDPNEKTPDGFRRSRERSLAITRLQEAIPALERPQQHSHRPDSRRTQALTPQDLIETEGEIRGLWEAGKINSLLHLEGSVDGSYEQFLCDYFHSNVKPRDWILASHRCHYAFALYHEKNGKSVAEARQIVIDGVLDGRSMFAYATRFLCSAIVAGTASIAAGLALSIQRRGGTERVHCFIGDAGSEHGHFLESMFYAHAKDLPLQFIITDNNSSCGVTKTERRGSDREIKWPPCVTKISYQALWPHAGSNVRPQLKRTTP